VYELMIRLETLFLETAPAWLVGIGAAALIAGLLLWLAGAYFSSTIIGLLGAAVGSFCGLLLSQWLDLNPLISMTAAAAAFCLAAVLFKNVIIIVLAVIVFALVGGAAYSSVILGAPPAAQQPHAAPFPVKSFSSMDPSLRLAYVEHIAQTEAGFMEKLKALLGDALETMTPHRWKILLSVLAGAALCVVLIWLLKNLVFALCYSLIGTLLLFIGAESLLMAARLEPCAALQDQQRLLTIAYFGMVAVGAAVQWIAASARQARQKPQNKDIA